MPRTYKFDTLMTVGNDHEILFACEARFAFYPAHDASEESTVEILSIYGQRVQGNTPTGPEIKLDFLECDGLRNEICAHAEQERQYAREAMKGEAA